MKARIEFEIPDGCVDCPLLYYPGMSWFECSYDFNIIPDHRVRPDWCPLQIIEEENEK